MSYDELKHSCRESWKDAFINLCSNRSKKRDQKDIIFVTKAKTYLLNKLQKQNFLN